MNLVIICINSKIRARIDLLSFVLCMKKEINSLLFSHKIISIFREGLHLLGKEELKKFSDLLGGVNP